MWQCPVVGGELFLARCGALLSNGFDFNSKTLPPSWEGLRKGSSHSLGPLTAAWFSKGSWQASQPPFLPSFKQACFRRGQANQPPFLPSFKKKEILRNPDKALQAEATSHSRIDQRQSQEDRCPQQGHQHIGEGRGGRARGDDRERRPLGHAGFWP